MTQAEKIVEAIGKMGFPELFSIKKQQAVDVVEEIIRPVSPLERMEQLKEESTLPPGVTPNAADVVLGQPTGRAYTVRPGFTGDKTQDDTSEELDAN